MTNKQPKLYRFRKGRYSSLPEEQKFGMELTRAERKTLNFIRRQLINSKGNVCALCGKPIKDMKDCTIDHIIPLSKGGQTTLENCQLAHALGLKPSQYRKLISRLRKKIHLLEQDMSANKWGEIQYDKLPSQAFRKHTTAFKKHDEERFTAFTTKVNKGEAKINTSTVTTAEVIQNVRKGDNDTSNAIWKSLDNFVPEDLNAIVIADVSGSMYGRPMDISTSLALYFAERNKGVFANKFMTFSNRPRLVDVVGTTLTQKLKNIETADWDMNTNIEAAFDALLTAAKNSNDLENIPKVIYIISDMEFDACVTGADETAFENARRRWSEAGVELPTVVFWNVDARSDNVPATRFDRNVTLISGSNQNAFRFAMEGKTPEDLMNEVINSDRYKQITAE